MKVLASGSKDNNNLINVSELMLMLFAAFLLVAAYPNNIIDTRDQATPVKVNLPVSDDISESLVTAQGTAEQAPLVDPDLAETFPLETAETTALLATPLIQQSPVN